MSERTEHATMPPREPDAARPFGPGLQKYWDLLSPEEKRMQMDIPGLYSITVRELALQIATTLHGDSVFDAFCGLGGNAIAFALAGKRVIACELDEGRLEMAKANAARAGVSERITFVQGDTLSQLGRTACDAIFLDPPWGGSPILKDRQIQA